MSEVVLYHHVQGLTQGVLSFADDLRQAGHTVHTPDLFEGQTFETIEDGMAFAREAGFGALAARGVAVADGIGPVPAGLIFEQQRRFRVIRLDPRIVDVQRIAADEHAVSRQRLP